MYRYCGKNWSQEDVVRLRELVAARPEANRADLSRAVCDAFDWRSPNGKLKEMSCRVAMLRMQRDGLVELPPPTGHLPGRYQVVETSDGDPKPEMICSVDELVGLQMTRVMRGPSLKRWNELVGRYHYLGYRMLPGAQVRYLIMDDNRVLGAMGFGAAAWKVASRDSFIGWTHEERERNLRLIVGQSRFLILPWVHCRNLASKALAMACASLPVDWEELYGFQPALLETYVDTGKFRGICYKAANWINVGYTKGRGKLDTHKRYAEPVKSIWLKPLAPDFRRRLRGTAS